MDKQGYLPEKILFFVSCLFAEFNGMMRAIMVAGKAGETTVVVFPHGKLTMSSFNIGCWTDIGADTTFYTTLFLNMERLVCNEPVYEIRT